MIIIFNLIALGIGLAAFAVAFLVGHFLGITDENRLILLGAPVALILDLVYRSKTGHFFHPRRGGALFYIPVWLIALLLLPVGAATFFGPHADFPKPTHATVAFPSLAAILPGAGSSSRIATEADGRREATRLYPSLAVANSPLNAEFVRRYRQYQQQKPEYFRNPSWPVTLARECATPLGLQPSVQ